MVDENAITLVWQKRKRNVICDLVQLMVDTQTGVCSVDVPRHVEPAHISEYVCVPTQCQLMAEKHVSDQTLTLKHATQIHVLFLETGQHMDLGINAQSPAGEESLDTEEHVRTLPPITVDLTARAQTLNVKNVTTTTAR